MKKLIVIAASLLIAVSAHAQFGVVAGVTSTKANLNSAVSDAQNITQYHVGLTYKLNLGLIAIQPSILYNVKGSKISMVKKVEDIAAFDYRNGYLEIPVQVQAGVNLGLARVYGFVEPFLGYAISNNTQDTSGNSINVDWANVKNKLEYGVGLGAGVELIKHVQVSVRYFWNLGQANTATIATAYDAVRNSAASGLAASVAILF